MSTVVVLDEHRYSNHAMNDNKDELVEIENERERGKEDKKIWYSLHTRHSYMIRNVK